VVEDCADAIQYTPSEAAQLFAGVERPWWIAGGWAIDLWLERRSREHEELDVAILRRDLASFRQHLAGWELHLAHGDELTLLPHADEVDPALHAIWCRRGASEPWAFELLLNEADGDDWVFRRDRTVRLPISAMSRTSADGVPILTPEIVLLFKAKQRRARDEADLREALPTMSGEQKDWLGSAIATSHPGHPWLGLLPGHLSGPRPKMSPSGHRPG
jgi:hypothetical protein